MLKIIAIGNITHDLALRSNSRFIIMSRCVCLL